MSIANVACQGAVLTMEAVCGTSSLLLIPVPPLDPSYNTTGEFRINHSFQWSESNFFLVIANVVYGDETFVPFQPWNTGNCTVGAGVSNMSWSSLQY